MKKYSLLFSLFFLVLRVVHSQCPGPAQRQALINLQRAGIVESSRAGQIPLTDACGNQRYAQYVEIDLTPIGYTPTTTGNTQNYSEFVTTTGGDIWYIDWQGRGIKLWDAGASGSSADQDWLEIGNNQVPDNILDSIYTRKYASVNLRRVFPNAQFLVGDSTTVGQGVMLGNRESRWGFVRISDNAWSSIGQEGGSLMGRLGTGTSTFVIQKSGGTSPTQVAGPFRNIVTVGEDSTITFHDYKNTRVDTQAVVNFFYSDDQGILRSRPIGDISGSGDGNGIYSGSGTVPPNTVANVGAGALSIEGTALTQLQIQSPNVNRIKKLGWEDDFYYFYDDNLPFNRSMFQDYKNGLLIGGVGNFRQWTSAFNPTPVVLNRYLMQDSLTARVGLRIDYASDVKDTRKGIKQLFRDRNNNAFFSISGTDQVAKYEVNIVDTLLKDNRNVPDIGTVRRIVSDSLSSFSGGGIYGGSGTIPGATNAFLEPAGALSFKYSNDENVLQIIDGSGVTFTSATNQGVISNNGESIVISGNNDGPLTFGFYFSSDDGRANFFDNRPATPGLIYQGNYTTGLLANGDRSIPDIGTVKQISQNASSDLSGTLDNGQIKAGAVGTTELATDAVTTSKIAAGAVGETDIANGAVTSPKLADNAVTTSKINNNAVTMGKLQGTATFGANIWSDGTQTLFTPQKRVGYTTVVFTGTSGGTTIPAGGGTYSRYYLYFENGGTTFTVDLPAPEDGQILEVFMFADEQTVTEIDFSNGWSIYGGPTTYSLSGSGTNASRYLRFLGINNFTTSTSTWILMN